MPATEILVLGGALALAIVLLWRRRRRPGCPRCGDGDAPPPRNSSTP